MGLMSKIKGVLQNMNIIKELKSLTDIDIDVEGYESIDTWMAIYQGNSPWLTYTLNNAGNMQNVTMKSLNMARVMCQELAKKTWSEQCEINIDNDTVKQYVDMVLEKNGFTVNNTKFLEMAYALGGGAYNVISEDGKVIIDFVQALNFIPTSWTNNKVTGAAFIDKRVHNGKYYTLVTLCNVTSKGYEIKNQLFQSTRKDTLGVQVVLSTLYEDLMEEVVISGVTEPLFSYFKPNLVNNLHPSSPLGISIFANSLDAMESLDETYDSFYKDFKLGGKKVVVSRSMLDVSFDENGNRKQCIDMHRNVFLSIDTEIGDQQPIIQDNTLQLRVDDHVKAIGTQLDMLAMQVGFSAGTFNFGEGGQAVTATEIVNKNQTTYKTIVSHELVLEGCIKSLVDSIVTMGIIIGDLPATLHNSYETIIKFDDSIITDRTIQIDDNIKLTSTGLKPKYIAMMELYGLDEAEARKWVAEINKESSYASYNTSPY